MCPSTQAAAAPKATLRAPPPLIKKRPMKARVSPALASSARVNLTRFFDELENMQKQSQQVDSNNNDISSSKPLDEEEMSRYSLHLWNQLKSVAEWRRMQRLNSALNRRLA